MRKSLQGRAVWSLHFKNPDMSWIDEYSPN